MEENKQMSIDIKPEVAEGTYSNLAIISHSHTEFVIDFASILPGMPKPDVRSRIIMHPEHAKRLLSALADNVSKYESVFGPIDIFNEPKGTFNLTDLNPNGTKS